MVLVNDHTACSSLVIGIVELAFAGIAIICGIVCVSKLGSPAGVTIGMWAFYFAIPGVLCILVGVKKESNLMGGALAANIVGIILAVGAFVNGAVFWALLNSYTCKDILTYCNCGTGRSRTNYGSATYATSCSNVTTIRDATGVLTIVYTILAIVSFIGSIYGCATTCCAPRAPTVIVTGTIPQPTTVVVSNQTSQGQPMAYVQAPPMAYAQGQPMAYAQGQPMGYPQGQPMAYAQGQPMGYPQGQPMAYSQAAYPGTAQQQQPPAYIEGQGNPAVQYAGKQ